MTSAGDGCPSRQMAELPVGLVPQTLCLSLTALISLTCSFSLGFTSHAQIIFCMAANSYIAGSLSQCHGNRVEGVEGKLKGKIQRNSRRVQRRKRARKGWRQEDKVTEEGGARGGGSVMRGRRGSHTFLISFRVPAWRS